MELNKIHNIDCLEFMKTLPDKCIDLVLTDPPYNLKKDFANDDMEWGEFVEWLTPIFNEMARIVKDKHSVIIFFDSGQKLPLFWKTLFNSKLNFQKGGNLYKPNDVSMPHNRILRTSEVFYVCSSTPELNHDGESYIHDCLIGNHTKKEKWYHPTAKNIEITKHLIKSHSLKDEVVFDPFLGSGTTAVACKLLKRNYIGCEISPEYCKIAEDRIKSISNALF